MKILILSPLFPPDVGAPASYVKELMCRLKGHTVTGLIYGYLPESVQGVHIKAVDKRTWIARRLFLFTTALMQARKETDLIILNNAPSVELPMLLVSFFTKNTIVLCESDPLAKQTAKKGLYKIVHTLLVRRCRKVIVLSEEIFYTTPERLPFNEIDSKLVDTLNNWWSIHLQELTTI